MSTETGATYIASTTGIIRVTPTFTYVEVDDRMAGITTPIFAPRNWSLPDGTRVRLTLEQLPDGADV